MAVSIGRCLVTPDSFPIARCRKRQIGRCNTQSRSVRTVSQPSGANSSATKIFMNRPGHKEPWIVRPRP